MSLAKVKSAIDKLSEEERFHLQSYLDEKMRPSAERIAQWTRVMEEMDAGKKFSSEQVEELCRKLEQNGM